MFSSRKTDFDLVITDQTMPGLQGMYLARQKIHIRPDIPIILCTGYSSRISKEKAGQTGIRELLLKPLTQRDFAETIQKVLS